MSLSVQQTTGRPEGFLTALTCCSLKSCKKQLGGRRGGRCWRGVGGGGGGRGAGGNKQQEVNKLEGDKKNYGIAKESNRQDTKDPSLNSTHASLKEYIISNTTGRLMTA